MNHAPQPIPVEHVHLPVMFSLSTLVLFAALTLVVGFCAGGMLMGEATLRLHDQAGSTEGGRP